MYLMTPSDSQSMDESQPSGDLGMTILGIVSNIVVTSLLTGLAGVIAFLVLGFASPSGLARVGMMGGIMLGFPGGLLISFAAPLCSNTYRLGLQLAAAIIWATIIGVSLVYMLSGASLA
jgi:hypothetical protein